MVSGPPSLRGGPRGREAGPGPNRRAAPSQGPGGRAARAAEATGADSGTTRVGPRAVDAAGRKGGGGWGGSIPRAARTANIWSDAAAPGPAPGCRSPGRAETHTRSFDGHESRDTRGDSSATRPTVSPSGCLLSHPPRAPRRGGGGNPGLDGREGPALPRHRIVAPAGSGPRTPGPARVRFAPPPPPPHEPSPSSFVLGTRPSVSTGTRPSVSSRQERTCRHGVVGWAAWLGMGVVGSRSKEGKAEKCMNEDGTVEIRSVYGRKKAERSAAGQAHASQAHAVAAACEPIRAPGQ